MHIAGFMLDTRNISLSTGSGRKCFNVTFPNSINCGENVMFTASIDWKQNPLERYKVNFCQQEISVTVANDRLSK